jgi:hypothetical protein
MAGEILGAGVLGVAVILLLGGLLALSAILLPRLLKYEEGGPEARWSLGPGPFDQADSVPRQEVERAAPILPPREPLASRLGTAPDDPMLAVAIGLALTLCQQEQTQVPVMAAASRAASPWALSGRWQAMQARLNRQKR